MHYSREDGCRAWLTYGMLSAESLREVLNHFGSAEAVYGSFVGTDGRALKELGVSAEAIANLRTQADAGQMHHMMLTMQRFNVGIMSYNDDIYPDSLRNIQQPPALLFYRGNLNCLMGRCVTVVGSRSASPRGLEATRKVCADLGRAGVTTVSGLAVGVDAAAHEGCMEGGMPTAAVLACGMDVEYPAENIALRESIVSSGGVVLSEYPFGMRPNKFVFSVRNRIMSGLGKALIMMECRIRSGSMLTVQHALEQGRDVFAYPGIPNSEWSEGAHQLLREGAIYFTTAQDVLEDLKWQDRPLVIVDRKANNVPQLTDEQRMIFSLLSREEMSFDELASASGLPAPVISGSLTILEMFGLIRSMPGKIYCRA